MRTIGEPVRLRCTATGRYIGTVNGVEIGMFISAQDNSPTCDTVDPDGTPYEGLPMPSTMEVLAAAAALGHKPRVAGDQ